MPSEVNNKDQTKTSNLDKEYKFYKKTHSARHGKFSILQHKTTKERIAMKEKHYNSEKDQVNDIAHIKKRLNLNHFNLLKLLDFSSGKKSEFCSTFYWIRIFFEHPETDARFLTSSKKKNEVFLSDQELTHLLYNTIDAGAHLQRNDLFHGDITPHSIAVENPSYYKLIENFGGISQPGGSQTQNILSGKTHFPGPVKYFNTKKGNLRAPVDGVKNDVFGLGLSILEIGNAKTTKDIYKKNGEIDQDKLDEYRKDFADKHQVGNNLLVSTIDSMLELNPNDRPDFLEIQEQLPSYDDVQNYLAHRSGSPHRAFNPAPESRVVGGGLGDSRLNPSPPRATIYRSTAPMIYSPMKRTIIHHSPLKYSVPISTTIYRPGVTTFHHTPGRPTAIRHTPGRRTVVHHSPTKVISGYPAVYGSTTGKKKKELKLKNSGIGRTIPFNNLNNNPNDLLESDFLGGDEKPEGVVHQKTIIVGSGPFSPGRSSLYGGPAPVPFATSVPIRRYPVGYGGVRYM